MQCLAVPTHFLFSLSLFGFKRLENKITDHFLLARDFSVLGSNRKK
jgi:hypothetical protein